MRWGWHVHKADGLVPSPFLAPLLRQEHLVDDVDDAIRLVDVGDGNLGSTAGLVDNVERTALHLGGQRIAAHRLHLILSTHRLGLGHHLLGGNLAGDDMGSQDLDQLGLVFGLDQRGDGAGRKLLERRIGWREHREGTSALQRIDEAGRLDGGDQRLVDRRVYGVLNDVLRGRHRRAADGGIGERIGRRGSEARQSEAGGNAECLEDGLCHWRTLLLSQSRFDCPGDTAPKRRSFRSAPLVGDDYGVACHRTQWCAARSGRPDPFVCRRCRGIFPGRAELSSQQGVGGGAQADGCFLKR